jgi:hypothetical protein
MDEVNHSGNPHTGHCLVHNLFHLNRSNPNIQRANHHHFVFAKRLTMMEARTTINLVLLSKFPCASTSSKAQLSKTSTSSGSVAANTDW